jgi:serine protease Do
MKVLESHKSWLVAIVGGLMLVGIAVFSAQKQPAATAAQATDARQLSSVFRHVAQNALPSIVSIETRGKAIELSGTRRWQFDDENSPFGELFKNNPQFREFFERGPQRKIPVPRGRGSGFVFDSSGIIITNSHVVRDAEEVKVRLYDGDEYVATDISTDPRSDVAILRIDAPSNLRALRLGDSQAMEIGDWVLAVGSPFGLDLSVTAGIISAKGGRGVAVREEYLQTDAAINPGNSGGPLLNLDGEVIGVNTAISTRSGGYDGVGFAIPVNKAKWVVRQLIEGGEVQRAYLGVAIKAIDEVLAKHLKTRAGVGALVEHVLDDSPAGEAGLQPGDVVLELNDQKVYSPQNLQGIVEKLAVGETYRLNLLRDGEKMTLQVTVRTMPKDFTVASLGENQDEDEDEEENAPTIPENKFKQLGIEITELTPEAAKQLGMKKNRGVLIKDVDARSPASEIGLEAGFVIEKVGTKRVGSPEEFRKAIEKASLSEGILLLVRTPRGTRVTVLQPN